VFYSPLSPDLRELISNMGGSQPKGDVRTIILGLEGSGKTTILYKYKGFAIEKPEPTRESFNSETMEYRGFQFNLWDLGGTTKARSKWEMYLENSHVIVFVVDSTNGKLLDHDEGDKKLSTSSTSDSLPLVEGTARYELHRLMSLPILMNSFFLILANKQDLDNSLNVDEIAKRLGLNLVVDRLWQVQGASAIKGDGLFEGLNWIIKGLQGPRSPLLLSTTTSSS